MVNAKFTRPVNAMPMSSGNPIVNPVESEAATCGHWWPQVLATVFWPDDATCVISKYQGLDVKHFPSNSCIDSQTLLLLAAN